jgi:hypothetical protein
VTVKSGEVAFLKTTGEAVFVLGYATDLTYVDVRRPIAGQNGITHVCERFRVEELESLEDQQTRFMSERQKVMDKFGPKAEQSPSQDAGFPIN